MSSQSLESSVKKLIFWPPSVVDCKAIANLLVDEIVCCSFNTTFRNYVAFVRPFFSKKKSDGSSECIDKFEIIALTISLRMCRIFGEMH